MGNKWIYRHDEEKHARYVLGEEGEKPLICIGVNPSTAKPNDLDRTLSRVKKYTDQSKKYNGWIMLNIYPLRKTKPDQLPQKINNSLHEKNIQEVKKIIKKYPNSDIICAWGATIEKRKYLKYCLIDILKEIESKNLKMITLTKKGHPRHPLYCKAPFHLQSFDIKNYNYIN